MNSNFLKYFGSIKEDSENAKFKSIKGKMKKLQFISISDSAFDQTFKRLFSWNLRIDISGEERLKNLLNSFFILMLMIQDIKLKKL